MIALHLRNALGVRGVCTVDDAIVIEARVHHSWRVYSYTRTYFFRVLPSDNGKLRVGGGESSVGKCTKCVVIYSTLKTFAWDEYVCGAVQRHEMGYSPVLLETRLCPLRLR